MGRNCHRRADGIDFFDSIISNAQKAKLIKNTLNSIKDM